MGWSWQQAVGGRRPDRFRVRKALATAIVAGDFTEAVLPAGSWLWLEITAVSGSPAALAVSISFG